MTERNYFITIATSYTLEKVFEHKIFADNRDYLREVKKGDQAILIVKEDKDYRIMGIYEAESDGYYDDKNDIFGHYNNKVNFPYRVKFRETDKKFDVYLSLISSRYPHLASEIKIKYSERGFITGQEFEEIVNACLFKPGTKIKFDDIAGLDGLKNYIKRKISFQKTSQMDWNKWKELVEKLDHNPKYGILLFGPPGTGKTMFSRALANEIDGKYFEIKAHDISGFPGEAEKRVENIFNELLSSERGVLFIDEAEWILRKREEQTSSVMQRVTPTLLSQWSRIFEYEVNKNLIFIIMTTNQPEMIDPAFLRPGRFDAVFYVPPPDIGQVKQILENSLKKYYDNKNNFDYLLNTNILPSLLKNIYESGTANEYYCGADIYQLCKVSKEIAINGNREKIIEDDIKKALDEIRPSINKEIIDKMEDFKKKLGFAKNANK
ncbi:MAG: AAA family ATPase [candidate division WOR-3 bacterium]